MDYKDKELLVGEYLFFKKMLEQYPSGIISLVSDTFDFWKTINIISRGLKPEIMNRIPDSMGLAKVVFRPDSGNPVDVICGMDIMKVHDQDFDEKGEKLISAMERATYMIVSKVVSETDHGECGESCPSEIVQYKGKYYSVNVEIFWNRHDKQYYYEDGYELLSFEEVQLTPEQKGAVQCLDEIFGSDVNELGYKTINQRVGLIYGDSITPERANEIYSRLCKKGYAADNIVFGVGSYTYNYQTRDSLGFAMKMTNAVIDGVDTQIFKDPITDNGTKKSAKGLLCVEKNEEDGSFYLIDQVSREKEATGYLKEVFIDGDILTNESYTEIRNRVGYVVS